MTYLLWTLAIIAWLAVGYLPSRVIKHYWLEAFGEWDLETGSRWWALGGPCTALSILLARWDWDHDGSALVPWGWRW